MVGKVIPVTYYSKMVSLRGRSVSVRVRGFTVKCGQIQRRKLHRIVTHILYVLWNHCQCWRLFGPTLSLP